MTDDTLFENFLRYNRHKKIVLPCGPYVLDPTRGSIPYKRQRIALTVRHRGDDFNYRCACRAPRQPTKLPIIWPEFKIRKYRWLVPGLTHISIDVFLGQCEDCGTIYWSLDK